MAGCCWPRRQDLPGPTVGARHSLGSGWAPLTMWQRQPACFLSSRRAKRSRGSKAEGYARGPRSSPEPCEGSERVARSRVWLDRPGSGHETPRGYSERAPPVPSRLAAFDVVPQTGSCAVVGVEAARGRNLVSGGPTATPKCRPPRCSALIGQPARDRLCPGC